MNIKETERALVNFDVKIEKLKDSRGDLYRELCREVGPCPQCNNWHYPYCGREMEIYSE